MLKITIELVPYGIGPPETIAEAMIYNTGEGNSYCGKYKAVFMHEEYTKNCYVIEDAKIEKHLRQNNIWQLLYLALDNLLHKKDKNI